ncbi:Fic family protein [Cellvibrio sp. OA-2007]|uniref:Fic family protein n=1 Tax=Cellvibrio sp. OA-2007 TaxID=529823 RepID=UPI000783E578|nr:Fic family protein [Cellvibrio sp. OA-2007]
MFTKIDHLKAILDAHRPLPESVVHNLHEDLVLRWTYNSNAIEGNTLTLMETKVVLEGITIGGKSLREHFEAINHRDAILFVEELVRQREALSEWQIRNIHQLILKNIDEQNAGRYRNLNVLISGATHTPPDHLLVPERMASFISGLNLDLHPVEYAARVHVDFVGIHPFVDGNGRTSRLLMNLELMKAGFPPVVIPVEQRLRYYQALDLAHTQGDYQPFIQLVVEVVEQSFEPYFFALGIRP